MTSVVVDEFNKQYYERIKFVQDEIANELNLKMVEALVPIKESESVENIVANIAKFSEDNEILVSMRSSELRANYKSHSIYLKTNGYDLPDNIYTESGVSIDFADKNERGYYSTDIFDANRADTLELLSDEYRDGNNYEFLNLKPFYQFSEDNKDARQISVIFFTDNIKYTKDKIVQAFPDIEAAFINEASIKPYKANNMSTNLKLAIITLGVLIILMTCEINKNMKNISVRKLHGNSIRQIISSLFGNFFVLAVGYFILSIVVSFFIIVGKITPLSLEIAKALLFVVAIFIVVYILLTLFLYGFIKILSTALNMKKRHVNYTLINMNLIIKFVLMVVIIAPFLNTIQDAVWATNHLYNVEKYHDGKKYNYSIEWGLYNGVDESFEVLEANKMKAWEIIDSCGGIFMDTLQIEIDFIDAIPKGEQEFNPRQVGEAVFTNSYIPFIMVNKNYLRDYTIELTDGSILDTDSLKKYTFLIPESRKHVKSGKYTEYTGGKETDVINIKDGMKYYNPATYPEYKSRIFKDPVVLLYTDYEAVRQPSGSNNYIRDIDLVQEKLDLEGFKDKYTSNNSYEALLSFTNYYRSIISKGVISLVLYTIIMLVFLYQSVYLYMEETKRLISVQYVLGHGKISRYSEIIVMNLAPHAFLFMFSILFLSIQTKLILTFCATFMVIEFLFMVCMIKKFERNTVIVVLKGE